MVVLILVLLFGWIMNAVVYYEYEDFHESSGARNVVIKLIMLIPYSLLIILGFMIIGCLLLLFLGALAMGFYQPYKLIKEIIRGKQ